MKRWGPVAALLVALAAAPARQGGSVVGFESRSRVTFAGHPEAPHELRVVYGGTDRARWELSAGDAGNRRLRHRRGDELWETGAGSGESAAVEGAEAPAFLRSIELRRAVLDWPQGFAWRGEGEVRRADLGPAGSLVARLPEGGGLPERVAALDADGREVETIDALRWTEPAALAEETGDRPRPTSFTLRVGGRAVWSEEVVTPPVGARYLDLFFVPPDRRAPEARQGRTTVEIVHVDLAGALERAVDLPADLDLAAALEQHERLVAADASGLELEPTATFELDDAGRPARALLRAPAREPVPPGWVARPPSPALALMTLDVGRVPGALARVLGAVPAGARRAAPRVQVGAPAAEGGGRACQVVVPLEPPE